MSPHEAEKIINAYGAALAAGSKYIARKKSLLPCSKAKIRLAFYIYLKYLVQNKLLTQQSKNHFVTAYCSLNSFIEDDDAETINEIGIKIANNEDNAINEREKEKYFQFIDIAINVGLTKEINEINEYIAEC